VDADRIRRRIETRYCDEMESDLDTALSFMISWTFRRGLPQETPLPGFSMAYRPS
jgi:urocanate hydratase